MLAGVIGWPVEHSRSPAIHLAAAQATGAPLLYTAFPVPHGQGARAAAACRTLGIRGLSVTMPHKHDVIAALDELSETARRLDAVNHITNTNGVLVGNNTDGDGFVRGYEHATGDSLTDQRIAVIGSGGAARAVIDACVRAGAAVDVIARSQSRAVEAASLGGKQGRVASVADLRHADVVVNATPVGMDGTPQAGNVAADVSVLRSTCVVVDIVYHPLETPLLLSARARDLRVVDGLAMLAGQAAEQFEAWTGAAAPLDVMIEAAYLG